MSRFLELGTNVTLAIEELLADQDLLKLLKYDSSTPLSQSDIATPSDLLFDRIFPYPKIPTAQEEQKTMLTLMFSSGHLNNNIKFKTYKMVFNIICHVDLWRISGNIRPYMILHRIDTIFNEKRGSPFSLGKILFDGFQYREYNEKFSGFYLCYELTDFN
jgi:hypothetical protein